MAIVWFSDARHIARFHEPSRLGLCDHEYPERRTMPLKVRYAECQAERLPVRRAG